MSNKSSDKDISYHRRVLAERTVKEIVCILLCLLSLLPFLLLFINTTRSSADIKAGVSLIPGTFLTQNWASFVKQSSGLKVGVFQSMLNSFAVAVPSTILSVYVASMTAYGIQVYRFKLRDAAWTFIMAVMLVPSTISAIGFYQFMLKLKLVDTFWPLIMSFAAAPAVVFFMRQYMQSTLSLEMIEAARVDGCGEFRIFNTIVMPLMKPAVATQAIFQFVASWNNLFMPTMILTSDTKKTLPLFVQMLTTDQFKTDFGVVYIGLAITVLPLFIVYFLLSKYIVAGVTLGGVKE